MSNVSHFVARFSAKTEEELRHIIDNPSQYQSDAVDAAKLILVDLGKYEVEEVLEEETKVESSQKPSRDILIVSRKLRLVHYLIDYFVIQLITLASMELIVMTAVSTGNTTMFYMTSFLGSLDLLNYGVVFFLYYTLFEYFGQNTIGKILTKTVVVDEMGYKPSISETIYRTLSRFIPFEAFSCLVNPSRGWHDKISGTYVIEKRNLNRFQNWDMGQPIDEHLILD